MNTAPPSSTLRLRVGGRYLNREGQEIEILEDERVTRPDYDFAGDPYPFRAAGDFWYRPDGRFTGTNESRYDLIEETVASRNRALFDRLPEVLDSYWCSGEFGFLSSAFTWNNTPEGRDVWRGIARDGVFPLEPEVPVEDPRIAELESRIQVLESRIGAPTTVAPAPAPEPPARERIFRERAAEWRVPADGGPIQLFNARSGEHLGEACQQDLDALICDPGVREITAEEEPPAREWRYFCASHSQWRYRSADGFLDHRWTSDGRWRGRAGSTLSTLLADPAVREVDSLDGEAVEPAKPSLQLRVGGRYLDRQGRVVTITTDKGPVGPWPFWGDNDASYRPCGSSSLFGPGRPVPWDLVAEAPADENTPPQTPTYRLLRPGEQIRPGDEFLLDIGEPGEPSVWESEQPPTSQVYEPETYPPIRRQVALYEDAPTA